MSQDLFSRKFKKIHDSLKFKISFSIIIKNLRFDIKNNKFLI